MKRRWIISVWFVVISPLLLAADTGEDLIEAAKKGEAEKVRALLDAGADVNAKDEHGATALMYALGGEGKLYPAIAKVLLDAGADVNAKAGNGVTAVMLAAFSGDAELIKLLLDAGAEKTCGLAS